MSKGSRATSRVTQNPGTRSVSQSTGRFVTRSQSTGRLVTRSQAQKAARTKVLLDKQAGRQTDRWIVELAGNVDA